MAGERLGRSDLGSAKKYETRVARIVSVRDRILVGKVALER